MATTFLRLDGQIAGRPSGIKTIRYDLTSTNGVVDNVNLATGSNAYTFASGLEGLIVIPPSANTVALTLKGVTGDTGIPLHPTNPQLICVSSNQTSILLSAATTVNDVEIVRF